MNAILQDTVVPFLKRNWWIWLSLFVLSLIVLAIGPFVIGNFFYRLFGAIFSTVLLCGFVYFVYNHTIGKSVSGFWAVLRIVGYIGILIFTTLIFLIFQVSSEEKLNLSDIISQVDSPVRSNLLVFLALDLACLFLVGLGELLLYQHMIKLHLDLLDRTSMRTKEMHCPRCIGKGYVDKNDIERLGMEGIWEMGACNYCDAYGYVDRSSPNFRDPIAVDPQEG